MPTRTNLSRCSAIQSYTNKRTGLPGTYYATGGSVGDKQEISALNNAGIWVPGRYRANGVTIYRFTASCTSGQTERQSVGDYVNSTFSGDIAGVLSANANVESVCSSYAAKFPASADGYSQNRAWSKANAPDFDVGVILGELAETIGGLINPISAMRKYIKGWNKFQRNPRARRALTDTFDMLTGSWLEWRYGITPLISTIDDGIKHFKSKSLELEEKIQRSKAGVHIPSTIARGTVSMAPGLYSVTGNTTIQVTSKVVSSLMWKLTEPLTWQEQYGIDGGNLLNVLWEITPLSFVADWWLGIGSFLGSIDFSGKRQMLGMTTSQKSIVDFRIDNVRAGLTTMPLISTGSIFTAKYERLRRVIGQNRPLLPMVNPAALSLERQVDAASLLWQRMPKFWR